MPSLEPLLWRFNRLRCMSMAEVGHRLRQRLAIAFSRRQPALNIPPANLGQRSRAWIAVPPGLSPAPYLAAAGELLEGRFDIFALHGVHLGQPPDWNRDPKTGVHAPLSPGKLLNYRDPNLVGDIKYLWEPNRHLHLVSLAQAWALSGDETYLNSVVDQLEDWFIACPYGLGPNWCSALEAGLRLINWSVVWQLFGGAHGVLAREPWASGFRQRWLRAIYQHAHFIEGYFSLYSSANNHLVGEATGLFIAALTWPHWPRAAHWQKIAHTILEREALRQNAEDGVNREQAVAYQQFELELLMLALLAGRTNGVAFSPPYRAILEQMAGFLAAIMDVGGHVPMIGDADDGEVLRLVPDFPAAQRYRSTLARCALLFDRGDFKAKAGPLDDPTRWLLGATADARYAALAQPPMPVPIRRAFPEGGYYLLGCDFDRPGEIRLLADAGPLGYGRLAAHGHADALAFTLSVAGREFLIDPGTYAYHTQGSWRQYFRGTAAHNTIQVDGQDQSRAGGNFLWLTQARSTCTLWQPGQDSDVFEAWHDGYQRLADPVTHHRRITLDKGRRHIRIEDRLLMQEEHWIELHFHCAEQCRVQAHAGGYRVDHGDRHIQISLPKGNQIPNPGCRGETNPPLGWVSRRFDEKQPITTLKWGARLRGEVWLCSEIQC